jgi:hypothetical protein
MGGLRNEKRGISEIYSRRVTKEIVEIVEWADSLIDAVFVVISALRDHRGR